MSEGSPTALFSAESTRHDAPTASTPATVETNDAADAPRPNTRRFGGRALAAWVTVALALVGALAGAWWAESRAVTQEATARVAFIEDVGFGNLDAERSLIVDDGSAIEAGSAVELVREVELVVPRERSYIGVVITADSEQAALAGADAVTTQLIAVDAAVETSDLNAAIDDATLSISLLDEEITSLEASMAEEAATEAQAKARLTGDLSVEEREDTDLTARLANDRFWSLTRERNALVDERNTYVRAQTSDENALRTAGNLRVVEQPRLSPVEGPDPVLSAAIGGGLLGLGVGMLGFWVIQRRRIARR